MAGCYEVIPTYAEKRFSALFRDHVLPAESAASEPDKGMAHGSGHSVGRASALQAFTLCLREVLSNRRAGSEQAAQRDLAVARVPPRPIGIRPPRLSPRLLAVLNHALKNETWSGSCREQLWTARLVRRAGFCSGLDFGGAND